MLQLIKNQKGVALLIVLSSIMVLTTVVVEFTYTSHINYQLAVNAKEKLQAYYLAKSALNFSKVLLKYQKEAESTLESAGSAASSMNIEPLYKMMPLSSSLLREMLLGNITETSTEEESTESEETQATEETEDTEETEEESSLVPDLGMLDKKEAEKFLNFDGDFLAEIGEEQTKFDLNKISSIETTSESYDRQKKILLAILMLPDFKELFEDQEEGANDLVNALSDWVDSNGVINEFDNVQRGNEDDLYRDVSYKVKDGKFLTLSEMRLVHGMNDEIYKVLKNYVTVYSGSEKINICLGDETLTSAFIYHYTHNAGCTSPVDYEDDEKMKELVSAVMGSCPDEDAMATSLNSLLGLVDLETETTEEDASNTNSSGSQVSDCEFQFKDLLSSDNKVLSVKGTGTVGDTEVSIETVINIESSDPNKWKYYYYRVQ